MTSSDRTAAAARADGRELLDRDGGEALAASARRAREADRELALALARPAPGGAAPSGDHLGELGRRPALAPEEERALAVAAREGDARARARLVEAFLPHIASVARPYRESRGVERVDLLQEGVVGLLRAIQRYDPGRGVPLWAYAAWWVRQAMQHHVAEVSRPVVLSDRALRRVARLRDAREEAIRSTGREPGREELAERAGMTREQLDDLLAVEGAPRSVDEPLAQEEGLVGTLGDLLADPLAEGEYERVLDAMEARGLSALLAGLSERERAVLRSRFGLGEAEGESLRDVAERLGVSAERVRQIERRALGKLRAAAGPGAAPEAGG